MLIDKYISKYHYRKYHEIVVACNVEDAYEGILYADISRSVIIKLLFGLRGISRNFTSVRDLGNMGFVKLGETINKEIVFGIISNSPTFSDCKHKYSPSQFLHHISGIKAAINFSVHYINKNTTRVATETRVFCNSKRLKNRFGIYWFFISPFSSLIRYQLLQQIKSQVNKKIVSSITT